MQKNFTDEKRGYGRLFLLIGIFLLAAGIIIFAARRIQKEPLAFEFPQNEEGSVLPLRYSSDFSRIEDGRAAASITKYEDGFLAAFYGALYYFDEKQQTVEKIEAPDLYHELQEIRYSDEDETNLWMPTGVYYDEESQRLFIANYHAHNVLVSSIQDHNDAYICDIEQVITCEGMQSPENVCVRNGLIAVADYDGNKLWVFDTDGQLLWSKDEKLAHGVTVSDKYVYVTSLYDRTISQYTLDGQHVNTGGGLRSV